MKRKLFITVLSLVFLFICPGVTLAQLGSISGRVIDEQTGLPVMGAHVLAMGDSSQPGGYGLDLTDSAGFYVIDSLRAGAFLVSSYVYGYEGETYPDSVIVVSGENTPDIDFALAPMEAMGSISGRVTDEGTGLPLPMAYVWVYDSIAHNGGGAWTDTAGLYLIQNLVAGQYIARAHKDGYEDEVYPESVTVETGQNTPNIDFTLTFIGGSEFGSISGRVTDQETGLPIMGVHVFAMADSSQPGYGLDLTDSAGFYMIDSLRAGVFLVSAYTYGYEGETYPDSVIVVAGENTPDMDFALTPIHGGDANGDGEVDIADAIYLANYILKGESAPVTPLVANVNCDARINLGDVVYLANYLLKGGPSPCWSLPEMTVNFDGCKTFQKVTTLDSVPPDKGCIEYQYDGESVLSIKHINAGFNCCADEIRARVNIKDSIITIEEKEYFSVGPCPCLCLFDLDYSIGGVSPGEYTIRVIEPYLPEGDPVLEFIIDLSSSTSGRQCVERSAYPWGLGKQRS